MNEKKIEKKLESSDKTEKAMSIILVIHLFAYAAVMGLLVLLYFLAMGATGITFFWPIYPILGWGIGVGIHALIYGIYYAVTPFLAKLKTQSPFKILFIFHAWVYGMVNLIVFFGNISILGLFNVIYFYWPLLLWGIGLGIHGLGYITWDKKLEKEKAKLMREEAGITEDKARKISTFKLVIFYLLIAHIIYFIVAQVLIYALFFPIDLVDGILSSILWGVAVIIHAFGYYIYFYQKSIEAVKKGVIIHAAFYIGYNPLNIIRGLVIQPIDTVSPFISLLFWGIFLAFHAYVAMKYKQLKEKAETSLNEKAKDVDPKEIQAKIKWFVAWKWSFLGHMVIYVVGLIAITITIFVLSLDIAILPVVALGWLIGLSAHYSLYWILMFRARNALKWTFRIHLHVYIPACVDMVVLNLLTGGFPWSPIGILGWGIGIGVHYILKKYISK
ncbi:MAG: conserved membrane protein of unknown function [Promethearchaeota archaeon]|nr:MAG: conserved membrane protein of unknown function [Candidatus Lokiarchaeota archaeon]